jgi:hypothetical protein
MVPDTARSWLRQLWTCHGGTYAFLRQMCWDPFPAQEGYCEAGTVGHLEWAKSGTTSNAHRTYNLPSVIAEE